MNNRAKIKLSVFSERKQYIFVTTLFLLSLFLNPNNILAQSSDLQVTATIPSCNLSLTAKPEKRIPPINNWGTILSVTIDRLDGSHLVSFTLPTNKFGNGSIDLCSLGVAPVPGNYNFYLRGYSHLRKLFQNVPAFTSNSTYIDFSQNGQVLLAGETSNVFDNYINYLDLSTQIKNLYTNDYKNDLNQDGIVNALDLSNTISNFFLKGD